MAERPEHDVAVCGGGAVGLTVAALAHDAGARVCVFEPQAAPPPPGGPTRVRSYALTPAARAVLEAVGVWPRLDPLRLGAFDALEVWDAGSDGRIAFPLPVMASGPMGWIVEHDALLAALAEALAARRGLKWLHEPVTGYVPGSPPQLVLAGGGAHSAALVVAADGARSPLRSAAGIAWRSAAFSQTALCCNVATAAAHGRIARQRFLPDGPLALLPLADPHACAVVWTMAPAQAERLAAGDAGECARAIAQAAEHCLGSIEVLSERHTFALERAQAADYVGDRLALAGDAAHVVHPLAGQGLNLGLMDAAALVECVGGPRDRGPSWPAQAALRRYQRWRRSEALALNAVTDGLNRLFRSQAGPVRRLRGLGLRLTDGAGPLKAWLIARAMGRAGDLPALARPVPSP